MARRRKKCIVMIGTSTRTRGGISSVIRAYEDAGVFDNYVIEYVATHIDGSFIVKLMYSIAAVFRYMWIHISKDVSLVHIHTASNYSFWRKSIFFFISKMLSRKIIIHIHGGGFLMFYEERASFLGKRIIKYILTKSDQVIVLSDRWRNSLKEKIGIENIATLHNPLTDRSYCQIECNPHEDRLLFLGLVKKEKGVFDILSAMLILREKHGIDTKLDVCGVGDIDNFKKQITKMKLEKNVTIHGWVDAGSIKRLMSNATAFLLPSYIEGLPMSIIEAMAAGVTVIASNVGGIPDIIVDGENGYLVEPGDTEGLASKIKRVVQNRKESDAINAKAKELIMTTYSQDVVIKRLMSIYSNVLKHDVDAVLLKRTGERKKSRVNK